MDNPLTTKVSRASISVRENLIEEEEEKNVSEGDNKQSAQIVPS